MYDYNFDLLYSDDIDKVYDYYKKANDDFTKRNNELLIKQDLRNYIGQEQFNNWLYDTKPQKYNNYFDVSWSIAEVIYNFDIPRQVVEKIIDNHKSYRDEVTIEEEFEDGSKALIFDNKLLYEYDLDMIYDKNHKITELIDLGKQGYIIDEMIHK